MSEADSTASPFCPDGVPIRIYGAYLEARAALRADAPSLAIQTLEWLLGHLAEEQGAPAALGLSAKVEWLRRQGVLLPRLRQSLIDQALSTNDTRERAWALLSIAEHAFHRLYL
jgi:hypothetical protein